MSACKEAQWSWGVGIVRGVGLTGKAERAWRGKRSPKLVLTLRKMVPGILKRRIIMCGVLKRMAMPIYGPNGFMSSVEEA